MKTATVHQAAPKTAVVLAAGQSQGINLGLIGVPASLQKLRPTEGYFPERFNSLGKPLWQQMFKDELFAQDLRLLSDKSEAWLFTVRSYMSVCDNAGLDPFRNRTDSTINNQVRKVLLARRHLLVRFLDRIRLLTAVSPEPVTCRRSYEITSPGNLKITAQMHFTHADRGALIAFLKHHRFFHTGDGGYVRNLLKTLKVQVKSITSKRAVLSYEIELAPPFFIPEDRKSAKTQRDWFDKEFFNPTIRGSRFQTYLRRIKF